MKKSDLIIWAFPLVGVIISAIAANQYFQTKEFVDAAVRIEGQIVDIDVREGLDYPIIEFVDPHGQTRRYNSTAGSSLPIYYVGKKMQILYLGGVSPKVKIDGYMYLWSSAHFLAVIGFVFSAAGVLCIYALWSQRRRRRKLRSSGKRIQTKFQTAALDSEALDSEAIEAELSSDNKNPYRIYSTWQHPLTGKTYFFESEAIWYDPLEFIKTDTVDVFIDIDNPENYVMDISFLPKLSD